MSREKITDTHLRALCDRLNRLTNNPMEPYRKDDDGKNRAQIGNYHIDHAYSGVNLVRMVTAGGGVSCPINHGHVPKRQLYDLMHAYIRGIEDGRVPKGAE